MAVLFSCFAKKGYINKVVPIDKSSTVLTILLALIFLREGISGVKILSILLIGGGTLLMIDKKDTKVDRDYLVDQPNGHSGISLREKGSDGWLVYAILSAIFASLTAILGKIGIAGIDSNLGTAIRTTVVLVMAWLMVFLTGKQKEILKNGEKRTGFYLPFWVSNRCFLVVLLPGASGWSGECGRSDRQIEYACYHCIFVDRISRKIDGKGCCGCFADYE